ncbi:MAG: hypothetical protein KGY80_06685 [Candidatus Thorarchaeota archaeon]|nr:hypothetical protein [Candidatus Thorarchaeota archaeon]
MDDSIELWSSNDKQWKHLESYYVFLTMMEQGTLLTDIARITHIHKNTIHGWSNGVLPLPVLIAVEPESERVIRLSKKHPILLDKSISEEHYPKDINKLMHWIRERIPGLMKHQDFSSLADQLEKYLSLVKHIETDDVIGISELKVISNRLRISMTTARRWILKGERPLLIHLMDLSLKNKLKGKKLKTDLSIPTISDLSEVLKSLYISSHLRTHQNFDFLLNQSKDYYRYLNLMTYGYLYCDISRVMGLSERTLFDWGQGRLPLLLHMIADTPNKNLADENYWLPLSIKGRRFKDFIEVPGRINSYRDLYTVLGRLQKLLLSSEVHSVDCQNDDFMYVLGFTLADGYIAPRSNTSFSLRIGLSRNYKWSANLLRKIQGYLQTYGISTTFGYRDKVVELRTSLSPFHIWLKEAVFGLQAESSKTYDSVNMDWLLESPRDDRIAFVQGLADGDGYATSLGARPSAGISSLANSKFIKKLLNSLGVNASEYSGKVSLYTKETLRNAAGIPLFRHARSRLENLQKIMESMKCERG